MICSGRDKIESDEQVPIVLHFITYQLLFISSFYSTQTMLHCN